MFHENFSGKKTGSSTEKSILFAKGEYEYSVLLGPEFAIEL